MAEQVIVRQNSEFETEFLAADPHDTEPGPLQSVAHIHELTPYGMMLAGLGACTAIVLHTYAQNHGVGLHEVEIDLRYERVFREDCQNCETIDRYEDQIEEVLTLSGHFTEAERKKLFHIAHQCPIHKMFEKGIEIHSRLAEPA